MYIVVSEEYIEEGQLPIEVSQIYDNYEDALAEYNRVIQEWKDSLFVEGEVPLSLEALGYKVVEAEVPDTSDICRIFHADDEIESAFIARIQTIQKYNHGQ